MELKETTMVCLCNAFSLSMVPSAATIEIKGLSLEEAREWTKDLAEIPGRRFGFHLWV